MTPNGMSFSMQSPDGVRRIRTRLKGRVNVQNLLAAAAAALARGLTTEQVAAGEAALARLRTLSDCGQRPVLHGCGGLRTHR